ncbi:MAG: sulfate ABC transporter permease subunit CysT [Elusimicrobiota bacterium]|nr:sulfate ABC transporter permease subunit CysT [Elusimicrobiota bacterium]
MKQPRKPGVIPGFGLCLGYTLSYLGLLVLVPLAALIIKSAGLDWAWFLHTVTEPRVLAAYRLSFLASFIAAGINVVFGAVAAWVLVRYQFPGRRLLNAVVDLPFALPTAVSGIALTALCSPGGWIGGLAAPLGIKIAFTQLGVIIALTFISLPFVIRALQPAIKDLDPAVEEAARVLGASPAQTFLRVIVPSLAPALLTGFTLAFARALGEYGSVIFISGNMPHKTEIAPLLIAVKLEQYDVAGAAAIAVVMMAAAFTLLVSINLLQRRNLHGTA